MGMLSDMGGQSATRAGGGSGMDLFTRLLGGQGASGGPPGNNTYTNAAGWDISDAPKRPWEQPGFWPGVIGSSGGGQNAGNPMGTAAGILQLVKLFGLL